MKKVIGLSAAALMLGGTLLSAPSAEARPGWKRGYYGAPVARGYYGTPYAYGYRRRNNTGAAVAAGIAGLAVGAIAAQQAGRYYGQPAYGYGQPAYGYAPGGYYGY